MIKPIQCIYSPKSKIHIDLSWQSIFLQELRCADKFNVLIRIIHSTDNANSVYADSSGTECPGMLINYSYLSDALCLSRSTLQRILNHLEADGYISRIKLGRGKVLAQATQKSCDLRDKIHASSLAAKTNTNNFHQFSNNFEVVYTQQKETSGQLNLTGSKNKVGQIDRARSQELSKAGQIDRGPLNVVKVKNKKTILDNQYQELNSIGQEKPTDCATVSFFDNDIANSKENTKHHNTLIAKSNDDLKQASIAYLKAQCPDVSASTFAKTVEDLTTRFALHSQHEIVNATLMTLGKITEAEAWEYDQQGVCAVVSSVESRTKENDSTNSNTVNLMEAFSVCDAADTKHFKACQNSATKHHGGSTMKRSATSTTNHNNYKIKAANQDYHRDSVTAPTANDLKIPVVEKEVLRKDWAFLADQNFYEGVLPDSQKIALVAIIDYVKRKGVVIGSDTEIYRWLYHTVSNHHHYYSRATSFKHLANILIKQLMNRRFERPSGFNAWERRIKQQIGCSKMSLSKRE